MHRRRKQTQKTNEMVVFLLTFCPRQPAGNRICVETPQQHARQHQNTRSLQEGGRGGEREVEMCYDRFLLKERGRGFLINFLLKGGGRVGEMWLDLSAVRGLYANKYHTWVSWFTIVTISGAYEVGLVLLFMGILVQNSHHIGGVC